MECISIVTSWQHLAFAFLKGGYFEYWLKKKDEKSHPLTGISTLLLRLNWCKYFCSPRHQRCVEHRFTDGFSKMPQPVEQPYRYNRSALTTGLCNRPNLHLSCNERVDATCVCVCVFATCGRRKQSSRSKYENELWNSRGAEMCVAGENTHQIS